MKKSQELQIKISESKERLNKAIEKRNSIAQGEPITADVLEEMDKATKAINPLEIEFRAALIQEDKDEQEAKLNAPDSQELEKRELVQKSSIVPFLIEAADGRRMEGPESEARAALLGDQAKSGLIPLEMLLPASENIEARADVATPVGDGAKTPGSQAEILQRIFTNSIAARLLVNMPPVDVGQSNFPVMLTGTSASQAAPGGEVDATAGSFTGFTLEPLRLQARYLFRIEDAYKLRNLEEALRSDLIALLTDHMDDQILNGTAAAAAQVNGFISELPAVTNPGAVTTWAQYISNFTSLVDGKNAYGLSDLRAIIGSRSFVHGETLYRTNTSDMSAQRYMEERTGGVSVSSHVPAAAANIQTNIAALTSYPGANAVAPIWKAIEILRDPYTNSNTGEVSLTAIMLWNFKVLREDGFKLFKVRAS